MTIGAIRDRWMHNGNFDFGPRIFFKAAPAPIRPFIIRSIRKKVARSIRGQGTGLHSQAEKHRLAIKIIDHVATILGDNNFLMGENPCGADAYMFAILTGASAKGFDTPLISAVNSHRNLFKYLERMNARYFS